MMMSMLKRLFILPQKVKSAYLRANMREYIKDKPVFDTASFARDVEAMLEGMWSEFISRIPK